MKFVPSPYERLFNHALYVKIENFKEGENKPEINATGIAMVDNNDNPYIPEGGAMGFEFISHKVFVGDSGGIRIRGDGNPFVDFEISKENKIIKWSIVFSGKGSRTLLVGFNVPEKTKPKELHWPGLKYFSFTGMSETNTETNFGW